MSKIIAVTILAAAAGSVFAVEKAPVSLEDSFRMLSADIKAASIGVRTGKLSQYELENMLNDNNPEVRKAGVKKSRSYIHNYSVYTKVLSILKDRLELPDIRVEAARALSYATDYTQVRDGLYDIIRGDEAQELRVMAYKAFWAAAGDYQTQTLLLDAIRKGEKDIQARRAAIWALFNASRNYQAQNSLIDIIKDGYEDENTRIEAVKSLYLAMGYYQVRNTIIDVVRDYDETKPVKITAILCLSAVHDDYSVAVLLEDLIRNSDDQDIKTAAIEASSPDMPRMWEYFHTGYWLSNGYFVSPIENE